MSTQFNGLPVAVVSTTIRRKNGFNSVYRIDRVCDSMDKAWLVIEEIYNRMLKEIEYLKEDVLYISVHDNHSMIDGFDAEIVENDGTAWYIVSIDRTRVN